MAGNPFRAPSIRPRGHLSIEDTPSLGPSKSSASTKKKRVKIQTPPHSPDDPPRRPSDGRISPPPPPKSPDDEADTDPTAPPDLELEEAIRNTRRNSASLPPPPTLPASTTKAPYNPFARTLATEETASARGPTEGEGSPANEEAPRRLNTGKPAMNVEAFKNILLTGSATPSPPTPAHLHPSQENSSGTDTSSLSRQSLFDLVYDMQTPRSSIDQMHDLESASSSGDDDDEHSGLVSGSERLDDLAPPAPPKSISGKMGAKGPQTVSFADFDESIPSPGASVRAPTPPAPRAAVERARPSALTGSSSDLNKPLPEPPPKSPRPSDGSAQTIDNTISASEFADEDLGQSKKAAPPPPISRRARSGSKSSLQAKAESDADPPESVAKPTPPPPPPSRKARSAPASAVDPAPADPPTGAPRATDTKPMPPPPPPRNLTKPSIFRSPSTASQSSSLRNETASLSSQTSAPPPAPPPRRSGGANSNRASMDISRPPSLKDHRRSSTQSVDTERSVSLPNLTQVTEAGDESAPPATAAAAAVRERDILADMSAFQAEIDALRARSENG